MKLGILIALRLLINSSYEPKLEIDYDDSYDVMFFKVAAKTIFERLCQKLSILGHINVLPININMTT